MIDPRRIEVIDDRDAEILRQLGPERRLAMVSTLCAFARGIAEAAIRERFPEWSDAQVMKELVRRVAGGN